MRAFYDEHGQAVLWLIHQESRLVNLQGYPIALVRGDGIYNRRGRHVAWWDNLEIRDHDGRLLMADLNAVDLGDMKPPWHPRPVPPSVGSSMPVWPTLGLKPSVKPNPRREWASATAFIHGLSILSPHAPRMAHHGQRDFLQAMAAFRVRLLANNSR